jgi:hypothetical protein
VVVVAFQIAFRAEIHANDVFLFFKNYFWYQHIKTIQKVQTALNFSKKKKKFEIRRKTGWTAEPNAPYNRFSIAINDLSLACYLLWLENWSQDFYTLKIIF